LISLADYSFTRNPAALPSALKSAETNHVFFTSWCVKFNPASNAVQKLTAEPEETKEASSRSKWSYVGV
jgi:pantothenate kinase-related protein Tda10